jgi:hypothetical protein
MIKTMLLQVIRISPANRSLTRRISRPGQHQRVHEVPPPKVQRAVRHEAIMNGKNTSCWPSKLNVSSAMTGWPLSSRTGAFD